MTTTDTMNTIATVEQSIRIIESGADYVRITAPSINEAKNLELIKKELRARGFNTPLIADIHFTPNAAEVAARIVEKVRVNPGNYVDKKKFNIIEYSDSEYGEELERIREKFSPLVKICKEYGTAMRIGTNHGSLSDRIMSRFGDTPLGMVESALEFLRICVDLNYNDIVLSMKSSNPKVMIDAYRLLVQKMELENMNYPLHLGVTEAGDGEDGRIKSAIGISTLFEEGLGDTIRVSLTEEPEFEIPVCKILIDRYKNVNEYFEKIKIKSTINSEIIKPPVVIISIEDLNYDVLKEVGYYYSESLDKWNISDVAPDYIYLGKKECKIKLPGTLKIIYDFDFWKTLENKNNSIPLINFSDMGDSNISGEKFILSQDYNIREISVINKISDNNISGISVINKINDCVILKRNYKNIFEEKFIIYSAIDFGSLIIDGYGSGIWIEAEGIKNKTINSVSFGILQATRTRISKTEYISCPSCGRTLFDLQETTAKVREKTNHLKGLKIAIMGCIVNGPGEMADADYGYVGSGVGKITLYKGKEVIKRAINSDIAVDELINLIKENGDWLNPEN